jgi:oligosaccharide repeat unit polymerase
VQDSAVDIFQVLVTLSYLILSAAFLRLSQIVYGDMFAPAGLYSSITLFSLGLWHLHFVPLVGLSLEVYLVALLSIISVFMGSFVACPGCGQNIARSRNKTIKGVSGAGLGVFFWIIITLSGVGWLVLVTRFMASYGASAIWQSPYLLQNSFQAQYIGYLNLTGILAFPTFVLLRQAKLARLRHMFVLISPIIGLLLAGVKSYIIFSSVTAFLIYTMNSDSKGRSYKLALLAAGGLAFFVLYDRIIDIFVSLDTPSSGNSVVDALSRPYIYVTGGWSALFVVSEEGLSQPHWGYYSLLWLWKILGSGFGLIAPVSEYSRYVEISAESGIATNVYTFAGSLYWDFGLIGVVLGCAGWGFIATKFYAIANRNKSWVFLLLAALLNYGMFLSFMTYYYQFNMLFLFVITIILYNVSQWLSRIKI